MNLKNLFLFLTFFFSILYASDTYRLEVKGFGRASEDAIRLKTYLGKKLSCTEAARLNALQNSSIDGNILLQGSPESPEIQFSTAGKLPPFFFFFCRSVKNDYEECICKLKIKKDPPLKTTRVTSRGEGWIDEDNYETLSEGRASSKAIEKESPAMKETTCVEAARLSAVGKMFSDIAREKGIRHYNIRIQSPQIWLKSCESTDNEFAKCRCKVMLYAKGLKDRVEKAMEE